MVNETSPTPLTNKEKQAPASQRGLGRRRLLPPIWVWVALAACAGGIAFAQRPGAYDHQIGNIVTLILAFGGTMVFLGWFIFLSGYGFLLRMALLAAVFLAPTAFFSLFRIEQVSGELIPRFAYRFAPKRDAVLAVPTASSSDAVELTPTPQDFPQFLGPNRDLSVSPAALARDWKSQPPQQVWRQPIGAGWSGFVAVNGFAVTMEQRGDTELITCYEVETGNLCWSHGLQTRHETVLGGVGPRSTPTLYEGKVYALGATGALRCLDGAQGALLWSKDLLAEFGVSAKEDLANIAWGRAASPLIVDNRVIVPAGGPSDKPVSLVAYDRLTGKEIWRGGQRQISFASPSLATIGGVRQILIVNEDTVSGHDVASGKLLWSHPWAGKSNQNASVSQAVALPGDRVFLSKGYGGGALMLEVAREAEDWTVSEVWSDLGLLKTKFTNIAVKDGYAYGLSDGILECAYLHDGQRQWKRGRYGHGQVLLVGDALLVQAESGEVVLVEATPRESLERGRFQAIEGKTWNNLCLYGPYLLTRNSDEAACYRLPLEK